MEEARDAEPGLPEFLRDPVGMLERRWLPIAATLLLGLGVTAGLTFTQTPLYSARASVLLVSQKIGEGFVRPTIEEDSPERLDALVREVLSTRYLSQIIEAHDLYPELRAALGLAEVAARMRSRITVEIEPQLTPPTGPRLQTQTAQILGIEFAHTDPEQAAAVTNALARSLTDAGLRARTERARTTTQFLGRELKDAETALLAVSREISQFQQQHRGELPSDYESNLRRIERLEDQRQTLTTQIAEAETRIAVASVQAPENSPQAQLEAARGDLARELSVNTETHPNVVSLRRQIAELEAAASSANTESSRDVLDRAGRRELADLRRQLATTESELRELDARVARTPGRTEQLAALQQRFEVAEETHRDLLRKAKDAEIAESLELAQQGERMAILEEAVPPLSPDRSPWRRAAQGAIAAFGLALCVGLALEWWDPVLSTVKGVESASGLPVIGTVPRIR